MASFGPIAESETIRSAQTDLRMRAIANRYLTHFNYEAAFANATRGQVIMAEAETFLGDCQG